MARIKQFRKIAVEFLVKRGIQFPHHDYQQFLLLAITEKIEELPSSQATAKACHLKDLRVFL
jgi:hypothetical protein